MICTHRRGACLAATILLLLPVCGDDEVVEQPPTGPVTLDQLIQACITSSACGVTRYPSVPNCVNDYFDRHIPLEHGPVYDKLYHCVTTADGCDEVFACYGSHQAAGSCGIDFKAQCDGDKAISCDTLSKKVFIFDCAAADMTCKTRATESFVAYCTRGTCDTSFERRCEGSQRLTCVDGTIEVDNCASRGLVCEKTLLTEEWDCVGEQEEKCDIPPDKLDPSCEGSMAISCVNNKLHKEDCSKRTFMRTCRHGACAFVGTECDHGSFNRCQGDKLQYCREGKWTIVDCVALGLSPCVSAVHGANCSERW